MVVGAVRTALRRTCSSPTASARRRSTAGRQPVQPVPFSHALHAGELGLDLPLLPQRGGEGRARRRASDADLRELPHADPPREPEPREGPRRATRTGMPIEWIKVAQGRRLRVLQPRRARAPRRQLRRVPPARVEPDGARAPRAAALDRLVPRTATATRWTTCGRRERLRDLEARTRPGRQDERLEARSRSTTSTRTTTAPPATAERRAGRSHRDTPRKRNRTDMHDGCEPRFQPSPPAPRRPAGAAPRAAPPTGARSSRLAQRRGPGVHAP
jgi:hypothetical protein